MQVLAALDRFNQRHPWSHNDRFLAWVERRVAASGAREVLDVGCGTGNLIDRLRHRARVVGLEPDPATAAIATARFAGDPAVHVATHGFLDRDPQLRWDAITIVAVLHHLPLEPTLRELRGALRPGGRLVVVGCRRDAGAVDLALAVVSLLANPIVGLVKHPASATDLPENMRAPTTPAAQTFEGIVAAAERDLPGARARRRLFWRYTLVYDAP
ncbi:methyltransferase type 12 (plasmid) [Pseudonocardia sp. EC080625-04]|uniref:class I SAM-dependent methyltransferase n=1 Tax=Pseudonocardia sp. EC080625-04 TaxID=1096868 RepID=UPI0006CB3D19|nr:class I SAM-dependent methyltransferase [Pseudonocardia sp. EC080625-04]ALE71945.1 methyltransferase type 12 [Pseudonocardia sp. EC080625-04]ALE76784.1 methyltransferase type 12 [Pseudonocardia sp. EC080625-04]